MTCRICDGRLTPSRFAGLARCATCGAHFSSHAPDPRAYASDAYLADNADIQWDHAQRRFEARIRLDWMATWTQGGDLYEVGAAAGWFLDAARERGFGVRGVEPSPALSAHARDTLDLDVVTGLAEDQPPHGRADAVCLWHVVEHASDPVALLRASAAQVKPGGLVFLEVPNIASPLAQRLGMRWPALADRSHVTQFTPPALRTALERAGLQPVHLVTVPRWTYRAQRLRPRAAASLVRDVWLSRGVVRPDASRGDLLRAVARR